MRIEKLKSSIRNFTYVLEFILALFIVASVVIGMIDLVRYLILIFTTNAIETYEVYQKFLGHVLLMVVGVELVVMLVYHTPSSVIEVLLYAVARKLLIGNEGMIDFIIGIGAIAAIFAIRRFLFVEDLSYGKTGEYMFSAATSVSEINEQLNLKIPEELGNTIGGVVCCLAQEVDIPVREGIKVSVDNISIRVLRLRDGLIEKVSIKIN